MEDFYGEIKRFFTSHDVAIKYAKITVFLSFCAIAYNLFIVPIHLVAGGSAGVGVLFKLFFFFQWLLFLLLHYLLLLCILY